MVLTIPLLAGLFLSGAATTEAPAAPLRSVAVFPASVRGNVAPGLPELLMAAMVKELRISGAFAKVMAPEQLGALLAPDAQKALAECAADRCAVADVELASALGVTHLLGVGLFKAGAEPLVVSLRVLDARTAEEVGSVLEPWTPAGVERPVLQRARELTAALMTSCGYAAPLGAARGENDNQVATAVHRPFPMVTAASGAALLVAMLPGLVLAAGTGAVGAAMASAVVVDWRGPVSLGLKGGDWEAVRDAGSPLERLAAVPPDQVLLLSALTMMALTPALVLASVLTGAVAATAAGLVTAGVLRVRGPAPRKAAPP